MVISVFLPTRSNYVRIEHNSKVHPEKVRYKSKKCVIVCFSQNSSKISEASVRDVFSLSFFFELKLFFKDSYELVCFFLLIFPEGKRCDWIGLVGSPSTLFEMSFWIFEFLNFLFRTISKA